MKTTKKETGIRCGQFSVTYETPGTSHYEPFLYATDRDAAERDVMRRNPKATAFRVLRVESVRVARCVRVAR